MQIFAFVSWQSFFSFVCNVGSHLKNGIFILIKWACVNRLKPVSLHFE